jgi:hypothetical protein
VQVAVALYFFALGLSCRRFKVEDWPTPALPLLFGLGAIATGLVFSLDLDPRIGANPAYSTTMFVACLAPLWPYRLLLTVLVPVHLIYLLIVWNGGQPPTFVLVMTVGGTVAVALGALVAALQYRAEQQVSPPRPPSAARRTSSPTRWRGSTACSTNGARSWRSSRMTCAARSRASAPCCAR